VNAREPGGVTSVADLPGWPWPTGAAELERLQVGLAELADAQPPWEPGGAASAAGGPTMALPAGLTVGGVYVTYPSGVGGPGSAGELMWAAAVLTRDGEVVAEAVERGQTGAGYVAGLLALRCGPLLERAVRGVAQRPDLLIVDSTGRDHPRRAGLAVHLGAVLDVPAVGITNRALLSEATPVAEGRGATSPLLLNGEVVGYAVRTARGVNPVLAHAAWRTSPELAVRAALSLTAGRRTPEPLRRARTLARVARAQDEGRLLA
jgi:deoxyribonuclease V